VKRKLAHDYLGGGCLCHVLQFVVFSYSATGRCRQVLVAPSKKGLFDVRRVLGGLWFL
jgi:hypothetical protein